MELHIHFFSVSSLRATSSFSVAVDDSVALSITPFPVNQDGLGSTAINQQSPHPGVLTQ